MGEKRASRQDEIAKGFWPPPSPGQNTVPGRPLRPRFYPGSADHPDADPCPAGIRHSPRLDDRPAGQRNRLGRFSAGAARATAGSGTSPGDRRRVSLAAGPLGPLGNRPAGDPPGTGASGRRLRVADGSAGPDDAGRSSHGRPCWPFLRSSKGRFSGNESAPAWRTPARTANVWAGPLRQPSTPTRSGSSTAPAPAKPRSPAG